MTSPRARRRWLWVLIPLGAFLVILGLVWLLAPDSPVASQFYGPW